MHKQKILFVCLLLFTTITTISAQQGISSPQEKTEGEVFVRTNLLWQPVLQSRHGMESSNNLGILINGIWSHWIWRDNDKQYRTWFVQPEIHWCLDESRDWFLGIEAHTGQFNFKFNDIGYQGDSLGGGLTGEYRLSLSKRVDKDFSLGLGYSKIKYDSYYHSTDVMVHKESVLEKTFLALHSCEFQLFSNYE